MTGVNEIRSHFLNYFAAEGHEIVASGPLVPRNDPTLMFTNAGMVQFKNVFTGVEKRPYRRAVTAQKCVRVGGKHNDLDNVGYTARHHTFFEMLGNFSFGDYFKERAIELAWRLVTTEFGLAKDKLTVTVYHDDDDAFGLWKRIAGLPDHRIIRIPTSDNFWTMGDTGPCGPCSEIFYDHGDHIPGGPPGSPDADGDRFIEIWNLVFMQFETQPDGVRVALPRPSIDTGMGLERVAAVMQGTHDNYETDLMRALIRASADATNTEADGPHKISHRVVADHLRSSSFLVADGVLPSNEGRGYVLRRIMRRAMRHAQLIGARDPLMWRLVPALVREMGLAFPELSRAQSLIEETLKLEETRFRTTLARGLGMLEDETKTLVPGASLPGEVAFKLYDTFGFPLDLTQDALRARGMSVDLEGFNAAMERQRADARKAWAGSGEAATETVWFGLKEKLGAGEFLGYDSEIAEGVVSALVKDGGEVVELAQGERGMVILNQTPFYAESGGQVGDVGEMVGAGVRAKVEDVRKKLGELFVHEVEVLEGALKVGTALELKVDRSARSAIRANHSATHLLHEALRMVLGDHVAQKGSMVAPDRLRFDFAHPKPISGEELAQVEDIANAIIVRNEPVVTRLMGIDEARTSGARALFGEKYGDEVRVVSMGTLEGPNGARPYSIELCGGTHVARTGDIGLVSVFSEGGTAAGVRRIEARTGEAARKKLEGDSKVLAELAGKLRAPVADLPIRLDALLEDKRKLERELGEAKRKLAMGGGGGTAGGPREIAGVKFLGRVLSGIDIKDLKPLTEEAKQSVGSGIVALIAVSEDGKAGLAVAVSADLAGKFNAVDLVRLGATALGGKGGGGRPEMAQAGGPDGAKAAEALAAVEEGIKAKG